MPNSDWEPPRVKQVSLTRWQLQEHRWAAESRLCQDRQAKRGVVGPRKWIIHVPRFPRRFGGGCEERRLATPAGVSRGSSERGCGDGILCVCTRVSRWQVGLARARVRSAAPSIGVSREDPPLAQRASGSERTCSGARIDASVVVNRLPCLVGGLLRFRRLCLTRRRVSDVFDCALLGWMALSQAGFAL